MEAQQDAKMYSNLGGVLLPGGVQTGSSFQADMEILKARLRAAAQGIQPAIFKRRSGEAEILQEMGIRVPDWSNLKRFKPGNALRTPGGGGSAGGPSSRNVNRALDYAPPSQQQAPRQSGGHRGAQNLNPLPKLSRAVKSKSNGAGRQYTSRFRGVHQTFPTRRWEAQFRRNGKPTSLGCFDLEEEAARAYDKMMLWCELHNTAGVKGGITNYDASEYEKDLGWLQTVSQDELIESLRSDGRRQAAHRMLRHKRDSGHGRSGRRGASRDHTSERDGSEEHGGMYGMGDSMGGEISHMGHMGDGSESGTPME